MEKPTPEQIQRACDLLNASVESGLIWKPLSYSQIGVFTALADTIAQLDAMQAERDKATADLGEISRLLDQPMVNSARAIAAPYRVETDPLADLAQEIANSLGLTGASSLHTIRADDFRKALHKELAKRGLEIGRAA